MSTDSDLCDRLGTIRFRREEWNRVERPGFQFARDAAGLEGKSLEMFDCKKNAES